jgi:hypothetical protein
MVTRSTETNATNDKGQIWTRNSGLRSASRQRNDVVGRGIAAGAGVGMSKQHRHMHPMQHRKKSRLGMVDVPCMS